MICDVTQMAFDSTEWGFYYRPSNFAGVSMGIIRICLLFVSFACVSPLMASAQETVKVNRVGFLGITQDLDHSSTRYRALRKGLSDLGYEEHKNLEIEQRYADGVIERLPTLADELAKAHVSVIVTGSIPAAMRSYLA